MEKINEIKIPKGVDRISVKQYEDKIVIEFIPEEAEFKEGDFVYEDGRTMIVKNYPDNYYAIIYPKLGMKPVYNGRYAPDMTLSSLSFRCATEDEKQLLIDAMEKDGKRWNAEAMGIEDILKNGDLAIFWGDNNLNPTIRLYNFKSYNGHTDNFGTVWGKAVKWDGTKEQFEKVLRGEID